MKFIQGQNRNQINLFPVSLDQTTDPDNEVRVVDLFVESLTLKNYGFRMDFTENGRPAYHPSDLLKLFIYGYMNKVRSTRDLEKECKRNIEVMWLLKGLKPDHNTQYKTVGVQWFVRIWFSHQLFPKVDRNALRKPNRFILSNVIFKPKCVCHLDT